MNIPKIKIPNVNIPKLIYVHEKNEEMALLGEKPSKLKIKDKHYRIYKGTKNRRIKKKQIKKSYLALISETTKSIRKIPILIGGIDFGLGNDKSNLN